MVIPISFRGGEVIVAGRARNASSHRDSVHVPQRGVKSFARLGVADTALSVSRRSPAGSGHGAAGWSARRSPAAAGRGPVGWPYPAGGVWGAARRREGPVLLQGLERPAPDTIGDPTARDGGGFDGLKELVPGRAVLDGAAHVLHPILEPTGREDPQYDELFHFH